MQLTKTSLKRLEGVHPDLVKVVRRAAEITGQPFQITEGLRTLSRQRLLVRKGASKTMNSRHLTGHAVDLVAMVGNRVSWEVPLYYEIADAMKKAADDLGIRIEWGGDWRSFFDGPHFQLPWSTYPKNSNPARREPAPDVSDRAEKAASGLIRAGDRGEEVKTLQADLTRLGYTANPDGVFGRQTYRAVKSFQAASGLKPDGIVGPKTSRKLKSALKHR